jgi:hypothetical protein
MRKKCNCGGGGFFIQMYSTSMRVLAFLDQEKHCKEELIVNCEEKAEAIILKKKGKVRKANLLS